MSLPFRKYRVYKSLTATPSTKFVKETTTLISIFIEDKKGIEKEKAFLSKVMQAIHIPPSSYAIYDRTEELPASEYCFYFGIKPRGEEIEKYQFRKLGQTKAYWADSLEDIQKDVSLKKLLWNSLQQEFLKS